MEDLLKVPMDLAVLIAGGVSGAMAVVKKTLKGAGKEIPPQMKIPMVGVMAFFASLLWFNSRNALNLSNWLDILAVTVMTVFLSVLWHNIQCPKDSRR